MQALILAAGMGKRLGELTARDTKCMVPVNGRPLIDAQLEALEAAGVDRITLVTGFGGERLRAHVTQAFPHLDLRFLENPDYARTNNIYTLYLAREVLLAGDTLLMESDLIFEPGLLADLVADSRPDLAAVAPYRSWMDGTVVQLDADDRIQRFVPKASFSFEEADTYFKTVNIYKFSRHFSTTYYVPFLEAYCKALGHTEYYEQVLRVTTLIEPGELRAHRVEHRRWYEIDDRQDLDIAGALFRTGPEAPGAMLTRYGGYWRFPELTDFAYLVNPYFPPDPLVRELEYSTRALLTSYPSGQTVQNLLAATRFTRCHPDRVLAGNGAGELIKQAMEMAEGPVGYMTPVFQEYPARLAPGRRVALQADPDSLGYTAGGILAEAHRFSSFVLVNPDNPSGHFMNRPEVEKLAAGLRDRGVRLIYDESFADFADRPGRFSLLDQTFLDAHPNVLVIKSISKSYGIPGVRLGVAATADAAWLQSLRAGLPLWNINSFGEGIMQMLGKYAPAYEAACDRLAQERTAFSALLSGIPGVTVFPSAANFLLIRLPGGLSMHALKEALYAGGLLVKDLSGRAGLDSTYGWMRLAVRTGPENRRLAAALERLIRAAPAGEQAS